MKLAITSAFLFSLALVSAMEYINHASTSLESSVCDKVYRKLHGDTANCYIQKNNQVYSFELEK